MIELIIIPLSLSRILLKAQLGRHIERVKGRLTNWSFFVVVYTIVGLNREVFIDQPFSMVPVVIIAIASTFFLGACIEWVSRIARIDSRMTASLILIGTLKNYGLAGGPALALFSKQTAVPATVSTVFMIVYIVWLGFKRKETKKP